MRGARVLLGLAAASVAAVVALPAAGHVGGRQADVTLQVVPRGNGSVTGAAGGSTFACTKSEEPDSCAWVVPAGTEVVLTAHPQGSSNLRWSTPDCPGLAPCRVTVDEDTTIVVLLGELELRVVRSGAEGGDRIVSEDGRIDCPSKCAASYPIGAAVRLTAQPGAGSVFTSFPYGCDSAAGPVCTLTVNGHPKQVGVKFNGAPGPSPDPVVKVKVRVQKAGDGTGRVTATGLDCGGVCSASFGYGDLAELVAAADAGSRFGGWGGVCASDAETRCRLPVGPITLVRASFLREEETAPPVALALSLVGKPTVQRQARRIVLRVRATVAARGTGWMLTAGTRTAARQVALAAGTTRVVLAAPRGKGLRRIRAVLRVAASGEAARTFSFSFRVRL